LEHFYKLFSIHSIAKKLPTHFFMCDV